MALSARQQARQGVLHPSLRRPHGRPDHALGQLLEGRAGRPAGRGLGPERVQAAPRHAALRRVDPGSARLGHRGQPRPDQPGQPRADGDRVRLHGDAGRLRSERRHRDLVPGHPRGERRRRLPLRLRRPHVRPLGRHTRGLAARARLRRRRRPAHPRVLPAGRGARRRDGSLDRAGHDRAQRRPHLAPPPPARRSCSCGHAWPASSTRSSHPRSSP